VSPSDEKLVKLQLELNGEQRSVEVSRKEERLHFAMDGRVLETDAIEVAPGIYSIVIDGAAFEARVENTPTGLRVTIGQSEFSVALRDSRKWSPSGGAALETEGRQTVIAPMPGRIVRILVKTGEKVEAGQGVAVVEAMKMQNEVRSPKSGTVERLLVSENQTVSAGERLAIIA
jgi:biotin carboxyl carrier protein